MHLSRFRNAGADTDADINAEAGADAADAADTVIYSNSIRIA